MPPKKKKIKKKKKLRFLALSPVLLQKSGFSPSPVFDPRHTLRISTGNVGELECSALHFSFLCLLAG